MPTLEHGPGVVVNVSVDDHQEMAGFEVSINGRFWVSTDVAEQRTDRQQTSTASPMRAALPAQVVKVRARR